MEGGASDPSQPSLVVQLFLPYFIIWIGALIRPVILFRRNLSEFLIFFKKRKVEIATLLYIEEVLLYNKIIISELI